VKQSFNKCKSRSTKE